MLLASVSVANNLTFLTAWSQLVLVFRSNVGIHGTHDVDCTGLCRKGSRTSPGLVQPECSYPLTCIWCRG